MTTSNPRTGPGWSGRLLIALTLILVGAVASTWALARYDRAAQLLGVAPAPVPVPAARSTPIHAVPTAAVSPVAPAPTDLSAFEARLARLENVSRQAAGSVGRADALLVAFAARRAIDRGVALGYLEPLLLERFGPSHPRAVATIVTGSHQPVSLSSLIGEYETLGPQLRAGGPNDSFWSSFRQELGELVEIRRADRPSMKPDARYQRAVDRLRSGEVDAALAETMRLPGATRAQPWIGKARRYVAVQRALDEIESAALLSGNAPRS